jgi:hypothetical protein
MGKFKKVLEETRECYHTIHYCTTIENEKKVVSKKTHL